jgi:hypothetical protein
VGQRPLAERCLVRGQNLLRESRLEHIAPHDLRRYAESRIMPNRDSETSYNSVKPADALSCYLAPCGIVRCASEAMEEAQHVPSGRLTIFLFSWSASSAPQPNALSKAGFQVGQECSATHVFGKSPGGCVRYFDLRLAPDYAESLRCGKAQAAAMTRSFGILWNSA